MALKIMQLAEDLIKAKQVSQEAEDTLKTKRNLWLRKKS